MAFVGISQQLKADVRGKISNMQYAEVNSLGPDPKNSFTATGTESWFLEKVWGEHLPLRNLMPDSWCTARSEVFDLHIKLNWDGTESSLRQYDFYIRMRSTGIKLPPVYMRNSDIYVGFTPSEQLPPELQTVSQYITQVKEINARWNNVQSKVSDFLGHCKSLNEALKLWPDLKMYIPTEYITRVEKKTERSSERSSAADVLATINTDEIAAAAVIARMSGAAV
jgi:hypothetical protein